MFWEIENNLGYVGAQYESITTYWIIFNQSDLILFNSQRANVVSIMSINLDFISEAKEHGFFSE
jgi:hypothetical protein